MSEEIMSPEKLRVWSEKYREMMGELLEECERLIREVEEIRKGLRGS